VAAGFVDFEITRRKDVFSDAPQAGSAANFGTLGVNFRARKAVNEEEWTAAMTAMRCEVPPLVQKRRAHDSCLYRCRVL
jgi:hypothetical protein